MSVRYVPPSTADFRRIKTSSQMRDVMGDTAQDAVEYAQSIAPVDTGHYRDSFRVEEDVVDDRAVAYLVNDAEYAAQVEWTQGHHVLSRTIDFIEGGS